jgi:hypothetical protein
VGGLSKAIAKAVGAGSAAVKRSILSTDRLPYRWGAVTPGTYDSCMRERTLVAGPNGPRRIDELQPGDRIWSRDADGQLAEQKIVAAWRSVDQETYRLRLRGRNVDASANHSFLRVVPVRHKTTGGPCANDPSHPPARGRGLCSACYQRQRLDGTLPENYQQVSGHRVEWVHLDQLRRGDLIVVLDEAADTGADAPVLSEGTLFAAEVTEQFAWLLGAIVGDGTVTYRSGRAYGVRVAAFGDFATRTAAAFKAIWGADARPHPTAGLIVSSVRIASMLDGIGLWRRGENKRVPEVVWGWSRRLRLAFCAGYAAADGSLGRDGQAYHSCSRRLIDEVRQIHLEAGHRVSNVRTIKRDKPITIRGRLVRDAKPLYTFVVSSTKREPYAKLRNTHSIAVAQAFTGGAFGLRVVLGIDPLGKEPTYDLNVTEDHNFIADGVVVHNSDLVGAVYLLQTRRAGATSSATSPPRPPPPAPGSSRAAASTGSACVGPSRTAPAMCSGP